MNIIILGDKFQKRMKSKGCTALLDYNKKPLFYYQYNIIRSIFPVLKLKNLKVILKKIHINILI
jgi:hypothetical protein